MEDFRLVEGGLVLNKFDSDMLNLSGSGGGDAIAADSSADSSLISDIKLDPLPLREVLRGDKGLLVPRSKVFDFFSRVVPRTGIASLPGPSNAGFSWSSEGGFRPVEFSLLANKQPLVEISFLSEVPFKTSVCSLRFFVTETSLLSTEFRSNGFFV